MKPIRTAAIIGMGALGILYGHLISESLGAESVQFVGDAERKRRYDSEGVFFNGSRCPFEMALPGEARTPDLLIFATKARGLASAVSLAREVAGPETAVISLLNGITSEEEIAAGLGKGVILYAVAQGMDATKTGNRLSCSHAGTVCVGTPDTDAAKREALDRVCEFFERARVPYEKDEDILHRFWAKWMLNVGVNQVCLVEQGGYGVVHQPGPARQRMQAAMREAMLVAQAAGVRVTEEDLQFYVRLIDTLAPDGMPSMRQDGLAKRPSEVEMFAGTVVRKGQALGVPVPVNEALYKEILEMESRYPR